MTTNRFLTIVSGIQRVVTAIETSSGSLDADKIPATSTNGKLHPSFITYSEYACVVDEKGNTSSGGGFTSGAWRTRTLNTVRFTTGSFMSLSSNQITLTAGNYRVNITCPAFAVDGHKTRLRNITDGVTVLTGTNGSADATNLVGSISQIIGRFTVSGSKTFEVQHRCTTTNGSNGFGIGVAFDEPAIFTVAEIWREVY